MRRSKILLAAVAVVTGLLTWAGNTKDVKAYASVEVTADENDVITASKIIEAQEEAGCGNDCTVGLYTRPGRDTVTLYLDKNVSMYRLIAARRQGSQVSYVKLIIEAKNGNERLTIDSRPVNIPYAMEAKSLTVKSGDISVKSSYTAIITDWKLPEGQDDLVIKGGSVTAVGVDGCGISAYDKITISGNATVTATGKSCGIGGYDIEIKDAKVTATGTEDGIVLSGALSVSNSTVTAKGNNYGINIFDSPLTISGEKTVVKASGNDAAIRIQPNDGEFLNESIIKIADPLKITEPEGGIISDDLHYIAEQDGESVAKKVVIQKLASKSDPNGRTNIPDKDDDDTGSVDKTPPAKTNPLSLTLIKTKGLPYGTVAARAEQGPAAKAAFTASVPAGFKEGFTFNLITNNTTETTLKSGGFTLLIPADMQKSGRTFKLLAIDKNGKVFILSDLDNDPTTITVEFNLEGYAFDLIYKD